MEQFLEKLVDARETSNGWMARCPAHDDQKASLSISLDGDKILLHCFAGCSTEQIVEAMGLSMNDLFLGRKSKTGKQIVATYDYTDVDGGLLYQVVRYAPKDFRQRRRDRNGNWVYSLKGVKRVLYNLRAVIAAAGHGEAVYVVEGERDCESLTSRGLTATTNAMGASSKWLEPYSKSLSGASVAILPDNDDPGRKHARAVAEALRGYAFSIKVVELPDLPPKGDVTDYLEAGGTVAALEELVESTPEWVSRSSIEKPGVAGQSQPGIELSDIGNAARFVMMHHKDVRYCGEIGKWLHWNGMRWEVDRTGEIMRKAKATACEIFDLYARSEDDDCRGWGRQSASIARMRAMLTLAESEPGIPIALDAFDSDDWLLNCLSGTIDLRTGEIREHRREDFITKLAPVKYEPDADATVLQSFLQTILPERELRAFVQRAAGYCITGSTAEEVMFLAYGPAASGKSTLLESMASALGDYCMTASFSTFASRGSGNSGGANSDVARLRGARLVKVSETEHGAAFSDSVVKQVTGGDAITARFLYGEYFEYKPRFAIIVATNSRPFARDDDSGLWRRLMELPFRVSIPKEKRDPKVKRSLQDPQSGGKAVLAWLVQGCLEYQKRGLDVPKIVLEATQDYRSDMNPIEDFVTDCCIDNPLATVGNAELFAEYQEWCQANGIRRGLSQKSLKKRLEAKGFVQDRDSKRRYWRGLGLRKERFKLPEQPPSQLFEKVLF